MHKKFLCSIHLFLFRTRNHFLQFLIIMCVVYFWFISYLPSRENEATLLLLIKPETVRIGTTEIFPLQFSPTIYLMLITLLMMPHHPSATHDHWLPMRCRKGCSYVLLMMTTNVSLAQSVQGHVNDVLFSGHVKFAVRNFIA